MSLAQLKPYVHASLHPGADSAWMRPNRLFEPSRLSSLQERLEQQYHIELPTVIAGKILDRHQWGILMATILSFLYHHRVPLLGPDQLWIRWNEAKNCVDGVAFPGPFVALPADPAAAHPDAQIVPDLEALRRCLRLAIEGYLTYLMDRLCEQLPVNPRALWPVAADRCAAVIVRVGPALAGQGMGTDRLQDEIRALVQADDSPLNNRITGALSVTCAGQKTHLFLKRASCCQAYRQDGRDYCNNCPQLSSEIRILRLQEEIRQQSE